MPERCGRNADRGREETRMKYEPPVIVDYGDLEEITTAVGLFGTEDGGSKLFPTHHNVSDPAGP